MLKFINAETKVTVQLFDGEHEDYVTREMTVEEALNSFTEEGCPTIVDAEPVKRGRWIINIQGNWACSLCGNDPYHSNMKNMNYCPNCGAKMNKVVRCIDCKYLLLDEFDNSICEKWGVGTILSGICPNVKGREE